jgi:hypothetical protein
MSLTRLSDILLLYVNKYDTKVKLLFQQYE